MFEDEEDAIVRSDNKIKKCSAVTGCTLRVLYTGISTFMSGFGVFDNLGQIGLTSIPGKVVITVLISPGNIYTTFYFWGKESQENVELFTQFVRDKVLQCGSAEERVVLLSEEHEGPKKQFSDKQKCVFKVLSPLNWVTIFSDSYFVMRESLMDPAVFNVPSGNGAIVAASVLSSSLSCVFNAMSESASILKDINQEDERPPKCLLPRYLLATVGAINENIKYSLPLYIELNRWLNNKVASGVLAGCITPFQLLQTYAFQSGIILENTPHKKWLDKKVARISYNKRKALVVIVGLTQSLVSFTMNSFYARQVFEEIFVSQFGLTLSSALIAGLSYASGGILTLGEIFSEFGNTAIELLKNTDPSEDDFELERTRTSNNPLLAEL